MIEPDRCTETFPPPIGTNILTMWGEAVIIAHVGYGRDALIKFMTGRRKYETCVIGGQYAQSSLDNWYTRMAEES